MKMRWILVFAAAAVAAAGTLAAQEGGVKTLFRDYSELYARLCPGIAIVYADSGHGSGFLVSTSGLVVTNHHVVRNSRHLAVKFQGRPKVAAEYVALSPRYDYAILRVNPAVVAKLTPLPLASKETEDAVRAGIPVLAFGSPLSQTYLMTQGIVAKVEENVLLGDFLIQQGNSGGPLVNLDGEVIGINTFAENDISGAVRIGVIRDEFREQAASRHLPDVSAKPLPEPRAEKYPVPRLKEKVLGAKLEMDPYTLDGGKFTVTALTPVLLAKQSIQEDLMQAANRYKRRGKKMPDDRVTPIDGPFYEWYRSASRFMNQTVTLQVRPDFGMTGGSKFLAILAGVSAAAGNRNATDNLYLNFEFKAEFDRMVLYRDGKEVEPIHPGRAITEIAFQNSMAAFVDEAYTGLYTYDASVFAEGTEYVIEIYDGREPEKAHKTIKLKDDSKFIRRIRSDFTDQDEE